MSKQDRQGARTPANLEQKYSFGRVFSQQERENARQNEEMNQQNLTMKQFISSVTLAIDTLQKDLTAANQTMKELSAKNEALEKKDTSLQNQITKYWETIYPVGHIYLSLSDTSPATLFGGTWERIQDRFLLAAGSTYSAGSTGGEATHTLTVDEMPSHSHMLLPHVAKNAAGNSGYSLQGNNNWWITPIPETGSTSAVGGSQPHNNMPPYYTVYVWRRTA